MDEIEYEEKTVTLISSGYDWDCPECDNQNHTIEIPTDRVVTCPSCKKKFKVSDIYSAYE